MSGSNYRQHPILKGDVLSEFRIKASQTSLKMYWFNAGFVEGILNADHKRKLSETEAFRYTGFPTKACLKFAIYWFRKGKTYSELWNCECFDKRLKKL